MKPVPRIHQLSSVLYDEPQRQARFAFGAVDQFPNPRSYEIDYCHPAGPEDMDMRRRMVVRVYHDPHSASAQHRGA
jgi:hypothetical protein